VGVSHNCACRRASRGVTEKKISGALPPD
jgi:hypothetical protein